MPQRWGLIAQTGHECWCYLAKHAGHSKLLHVLRNTKSDNAVPRLAQVPAYLNER